MTPRIAAHRLLLGLALGAALGLWYGFLRPLRRRHSVTGDGLFLLGAAWCWLYLGFALCGGDLRLGYFLALGMGALGWANQSFHLGDEVSSLKCSNFITLVIQYHH